MDHPLHPAVPKGEVPYDGQPPLITDTTPADGSVITTSWPVISATLYDPQPGSGVQPLSTTLILDSEVVTPQVNTAAGFAFTPTRRLTDGLHSLTAQVYNRAGNQTETGPWSFTVARDVPSLGVTKYYMFGSQRVAMRQDDVVYYLHSDHLGSTSLTTDITGTLVAETRYLPYGEERWITGTLVTDFTFTGQRAERGFGLIDYNARYYDPWLGRFISPDSIIPGIGNPQALDRYAYTYNNPLKYNDPSGHCIWDACLGEALAIAGIAVMVWYYEQTQTPEFRQATQDIGEQLGTVFTPPSVPSSHPDAFPLGPAPDPYSPPGVELDVPEWPGLPGVPLDQPDTGSRVIDFPLLDERGIGDNILLSTSYVKGFATPQKLSEHFKKHRAEFGFESEDEYLSAARRFAARELGGDVNIKIRANGDRVIYNTSTNEFAVVTPDGTIRTYFKPDPAKHGYPSNLDYFEAQ